MSDTPEIPAATFPYPDERPASAPGGARKYDAAMDKAAARFGQRWQWDGCPEVSGDPNGPRIEREPLLWDERQHDFLYDATWNDLTVGTEYRVELASHDVGGFFVARVVAKELDAVERPWVRFDNGVTLRVGVGAIFLSAEP